MSSKIQVQRICQYCKHEFVARTTVTKYCSDKCSKAAYKARKRDEKILKQQRDKFYKGIKPTDRIVSIDKPYLRPIVRGKEIKKVEFGAKVHKVQIDGISFIEYLSFDAYNEGTRLKGTIYMTQEYMHT